MHKAQFSSKTFKCVNSRLLQECFKAPKAQKMTKVSKKLEDASKRPTNYIEYIKDKKHKKSNKAQGSFKSLNELSWKALSKSSPHWGAL